MAEKPILIIHPKDKTTTFLNKIKDQLVSRFPNDIHHFNIYPNDESHVDCLKRIERHPKGGLIIFLGHGRTDKLYGSKGALAQNEDFASASAIAENPQLFYLNNDFINEDNVHVFNYKKIFCLSCNSNSKIATAAVDSGAKCFLGFGDMPTSTDEFKERAMNNIREDDIKRIKTELNYIIRQSLIIAISNNYSFELLINVIRFIANQRITDTLVNEFKYKGKYFLADYIYELKTNISVTGNRNLTLLP